MTGLDTPINFQYDIILFLYIHIYNVNTDIPTQIPKNTFLYNILGIRYNVYIK